MTEIKSKPLVLFVNPPGPRKLYRSMVCTFLSKANYIWQPQDFITLSAQIPRGYAAALLDCGARSLGFSESLAAVRGYNPALVILAVSSILFHQDREFLIRLRAALPGVRCLVMGDILLDDYFWKDFRSCGADLILNPMDADLAGYLEGGKGSSTNIVLSGDDPVRPRSVKPEKPKQVSLGIPRHELFIDRRYRFPFMKSFLYTTVSTQFGCAYGCDYCSWSKIPVTYRRYEEVTDELDAVRALGVRDIFFGDPSFGFPEENFRGLLNGMLKKDYRFRWACYTNPNLHQDESLRAMASAGCHTAIIGVEDEDFEMLGREFRRKCSREKFLWFVKACRKCGIRVCGDFIVGLNPGAGAAGRMVDFAVKLGLDFASFNVYTPLLGSVIRDRMVAEGRIKRDAVGCDTSGTFGHEDQGLIRLKNQAIRKFYLRPAYLARRITGITSFSEFRIQSMEMLRLLGNAR